MPDVLERLNQRIGAKLDQHIRPMFKGNPRITVLIRFDDDPGGNADCLVTSDDEAGIRAMVDRRFPASAPVGGEG